MKLCTLQDPNMKMCNLVVYPGPSSFPRIMSLKVVFQICFGSIKMMGTLEVLVPCSGQLSYSIYVSMRDTCVQRYLLFIHEENISGCTPRSVLLEWWSEINVLNHSPFPLPPLSRPINQFSSWTKKCAIFFKSTASTSLFTGGTFYYKIGTIFMSILCNTL
jgi:hypothetical protein